MANVGNQKPVIKIIDKSGVCVVVRPVSTFETDCYWCDRDISIDWPDVEFQSKAVAEIYAFLLTKSEQFKDCKIEVEK